MASKQALTNSERHEGTAPWGCPQYYGPPCPPEEEVRYLRNCLRKARCHNDDLQSQIKSLVQEVQKLMDEKATACYTSNNESDAIRRLEAILEANDRAFKDERQKLQKALVVTKSTVCELTHRLQLEEEKSKLRERECKEELDSIATQLEEERRRVEQQNQHISEVGSMTQKYYHIWNEYQEKVNELSKQLGRRETEILQLRKERASLTDKLAEATRQPQSSRAEIDLSEEWQTKYTCLQEQLRRELSEKDQSWESRFRQTQDEMRRLQQENNKLAQEKREAEEDKSSAFVMKAALEQENATLKQEKTELVKDKKDLVKDKKKLQEEKTELEEQKTRREDYITEVEALCVKMHMKRKRFSFHHKDEVDSVTSMLEKERQKREKEKTLKKQEEDAQRDTQGQKTGTWRQKPKKQKPDCDSWM
ncbi:trichohyalin-like [Channa argus]|uniref:trichohyalin-like n=1 Tax=Channa argus TaxID=215402 RepID=UPI002946B577|nr:hypothetical protein Q8A73_021762 [Channa argus]